MPHDGGDVVHRKSRIFLSEATLQVANQRPLFLRHPDIVAPIRTPVKALRASRFLHDAGSSNIASHLRPADMAAWPADRPQIRQAGPTTATTAAATGMRSQPGRQG